MMMVLVMVLIMMVMVMGLMIRMVLVMMMMMMVLVMRKLLTHWVFVLQSFLLGENSTEQHLLGDFLSPVLLWVLWGVYKWKVFESS